MAKTRITVKDVLGGAKQNDLRKSADGRYISNGWYITTTDNMPVETRYLLDGAADCDTGISAILYKFNLADYGPAQPLHFERRFKGIEYLRLSTGHAIATETLRSIMKLNGRDMEWELANADGLTFAVPCMGGDGMARWNPVFIFACEPVIENLIGVATQMRITDDDLAESQSFNAIAETAAA